MLFSNIAYAQDGVTGAASSPLASFLPLIVIFVVFYFLLIRPQQKRQKQYQSMLDAIKVGDKVLTNGGIYGTVTAVSDNQTFFIEIANGIKVEVAKGGISSKVDPTDTTTNPIASK